MRMFFHCHLLDFFKLPSCPLLFYLSLTFFPRCLSPPQSAGCLMGAQRRMTKRMTEWWYRHQMLNAPQRGRFHSTTPRSGGRLIRLEEMFVSPQEWDWKTHLDRMACLFQNLICGAQCGFWSANLMCTCASCLFRIFTLPLPICNIHTHKVLDLFHTPASLLCTDISLHLDRISHSACVWERMRNTLGPMWPCYNVLYAIYYIA